MFTSIETAELIKYAANAFLATKITFINEIADLCEKVGADVQTSPRASGWTAASAGSSCIRARATAARASPRTRWRWCAPARRRHAPDRRGGGRGERQAQEGDGRRKIIEACGGAVAGKTVAVLGLTFKPNTDDMRDSPSLDIVPALQGEGAPDRAFDPEGMARGGQAAAGRRLVPDAYDALEGADAVVILPSGTSSAASISSARAR